MYFNQGSLVCSCFYLIYPMNLKYKTIFVKFIPTHKKPLNFRFSISQILILWSNIPFALAYHGYNVSDRKKTWKSFFSYHCDFKSTFDLLLLRRDLSLWTTWIEIVFYTTMLLKIKKKKTFLKIVVLIWFEF